LSLSLKLLVGFYIKNGVCIHIYQSIYFGILTSSGENVQHLMLDSSSWPV
jgi:hypothetical protein